MKQTRKNISRNPAGGKVMAILLLLVFFPLLVSAGPHDGEKNRERSRRGITVVALDKFIGTYGFMENGVYWQSWDGYRQWLDLLQEHHVHYAKFWLTSHVGNVAWLYPFRIVNGDASLPPEKRVYDLSQYNKDYFRQLQDFVEYAYRHQIVVNLNVFDDCHLRHARNLACNPEYHNVQGIRSRKEWYSSPLAREMAKRFWDKVYRTLRPYPNVVYTVCNENYNFPEWQEDMARYMAEDSVFLDTGDSKITPGSEKYYAFVSIHWQIDPQAIAGHRRQDNLIFSSDGATYKSTTDPDDLNRCVRAAVRQGKGYEFYVGTAQGWSVEEIVRRLGEESRKVLGF